MNIFDVIREPKLTEKTLSQKEEVNQFAFSVDPRANKVQIKESIEKWVPIVKSLSDIVIILTSAGVPYDRE